MNTLKLICNALAFVVLMSCSGETVLYIDSSSKSTNETGSGDAPYKSLEAALKYVKLRREKVNDINV